MTLSNSFTVQCRYHYAHIQLETRVRSAQLHVITVPLMPDLPVTVLPTKLLSVATIIMQELHTLLTNTCVKLHLGGMVFSLFQG